MKFKMIICELCGQECSSVHSMYMHILYNHTSSSDENRYDYAYSLAGQYADTAWN